MVGKLVLGQNFLQVQIVSCQYNSIQSPPLSSADNTSIRRTSGRSFGIFEQKFSPLGNRGASRKKIPSLVNGRDCDLDPA